MLFWPDVLTNDMMHPGPDSPRFGGSARFCCSVAEPKDYNTTPVTSRCVAEPKDHHTTPVTSTCVTEPKDHNKPPDPLA